MSSNSMSCNSMSCSTQCEQQTICGPGEKIGPDSATEARQCALCDEGTFNDEATHRKKECHAWHTCVGDDRYEEAKPSAVSDRTCATSGGAPTSRRVPRPCSPYRILI